MLSNNQVTLGWMAVDVVELRAARKELERPTVSASRGARCALHSGRNSAESDTHVKRSRNMGEFVRGLSLWVGPGSCSRTLA